MQATQMQQSYREVVCFYVDDSGARDPDRRFDGGPHAPDWFALGGLLIFEKNVREANAAIDGFLAKFPEINGKPLHSYEIRNRQGQFRWLAEVLPARKDEFMNSLSSLIVSLPIYAIACVIDRPGYNRKYLEKYGPRRWKLCRTAFTIAVERAAKFAIRHDARLRVFAERSDKATEAQMRGYYKQMREEESPFDQANSSKYAPLRVEQLKDTLFEFRVKTKSSKLMQIADLVLWPVCQGGYDQGHRAFTALRDHGKLIECVCTEENGLLGTKYFCFELRR